MKVRPLTSIGAKLFYYMSALVLLTVIGISIQFRKSFMDHQTRNIQDSVQSQAEKSASHVEYSLEAWRSQLAVALPSLRGTAAGSTDSAIQKFIDSSPDFLALQLITAPSKSSDKFVVFAQAFTNRTSDPRFEEKTAEKVKNRIIPGSIAWLQRKISSGTKSNILLQNAGSYADLPLLWVAARFDVSGSDTVVWAILTVWQTNIVKSLSNSKFIKTRVIDRDGKIFSSPHISDLTSKTTGSLLPLVESALKAASPSGFLNEFKDGDGRRRIGAYSRLPRYGLTVIVEQDVEFAYQELNKNLLSTALWAAFFILISMMFSFIGATGITRGIRIVAEATSRIASGDFRSEIHLRSRDEVGLLGDSVNNMSRKIVDLMNSQVEKARFEKELETAKMVQSTFFPKTERSQESLSISAFYTPASECGGDLWGHFPIEDGVEFVFVADAMGHGAPAALVTAMAYSATMTIADIIKENPQLRESPAKVLSRINNIIWEAVRGTISITCFASIIDLKKGTLLYANAGHNFPVLLPRDPEDQRGLNFKKVSKNSPFIPISLKLMGNPLGIEENVEFKDQIIPIRAGDKIVYFTDGLIECESSDGKCLGRKWLIENICDLGNENVSSMKSALIDRAFNFFGRNPIKDDITLVAMEISKDWQAVFEQDTVKEIHANFQQKNDDDSASIPLPIVLQETPTVSQQTPQFDENSVAASLAHTPIPETDDSPRTDDDLTQVVDAIMPQLDAVLEIAELADSPSVETMQRSMSPEHIIASHSKIGKLRLKSPFSA